MSSKKTPNYQLHAWEPQDDFLRAEFNENFAALDAALAAEAADRAAAVSQTAADWAAGDAALSAAISQEAADRAAAVSGEASARTAGDSALTAAINQEITNRANAVSAEATERANGDSWVYNTVTGFVAQKIGIIAGAYTGDGAADRFIDLGVTPKALYLCDYRGIAGTYAGQTPVLGGLVIPNNPLKRAVSETLAEITTNGFIVHNISTYVTTNSINNPGLWYYIAFV